MFTDAHLANIQRGIENARLAVLLPREAPRQKQALLALLRTELAAIRDAPHTNSGDLTLAEVQLLVSAEALGSEPGWDPAKAVERAYQDLLAAFAAYRNAVVRAAASPS